MASDQTVNTAIPKTFRIGTDRAVPPEVTLQRVLPWQSQMGITRVANITGLDRIGIPVVAVVRPNSRSVAVAQGKGATLAAAKASGVMESIEAFHAEHIRAPLHLCSSNDLGEDAIDVEGLPRTSASHFHAELRLLWILGKEVLANRDLLIPYELVHLDFRPPFPTGTGAFLLSSNGLASGNNLDEAVAHGISELVERDANTLWRFAVDSRKDETRVDLASVDDGLCKSLLSMFEDAEVEVAVWETTSDVGIASFRCGIADRQPEPTNPTAPAYGSGCHPRREVALSRALTEAAQGRLTMISGSRDDLGAQAYEPHEARARLARFQHAAAGKGHRRFDSAPTHDAAAVRNDVDWSLERLHRAGFHQVAAVDLSKPEFGIPVVRVVIPGLEPISEMPSYVPGARAQKFLAAR